MFALSPFSFRNEQSQRHKKPSTVYFGKVFHIGESAIKGASNGFVSK